MYIKQIECNKNLRLLDDITLQVDVIKFEKRML